MHPGRGYVDFLLVVLVVLRVVNHYVSATVSFSVPRAGLTWILNLPASLILHRSWVNSRLSISEKSTIARVLLTVNSLSVHSRYRGLSLSEIFGESSKRAMRKWMARVLNIGRSSGDLKFCRRPCFNNEVFAHCRASPGRAECDAFIIVCKTFYIWTVSRT